MSDQTFKGKISIKPYCDPLTSNMGLEKYNYVVFPNTHQVEPLAAVEQNGKLRYLTGLNEFAPEVKLITDPEKKAAVIKDIRETIAVLERDRAFNDIKADDVDFWSKVELFKPDNSEIWSKINLKLGNNEIVLNPVKNLDHLIIIKAIDNGGFSLVSPSFEDCKLSKKKWYLDRQIDTIASKTSVTKLRNKALSLLDSISQENPRKLFYIAKNIDNTGVQYNNRTLSDVIYDNLDKYINGLGKDEDKKRTARLFIESTELENEVIKIKAVIKDALFYKYIIQKSDGSLYEQTQNTLLGRNMSEVLEYLRNPINDDILDFILDKVESLWAQ